MDKKVYKRYSIAFKQQVVREYEAGASAKRLRAKYGIGGMQTINQWLHQYGREGSRYKLMVIQSPDEQNRVKQLEEQVRLLESALAQSQLTVLMLESVVAVADEHFATDLKKNFRTTVITQAHAKTHQSALSRPQTIDAICGWFGISRQAHYQLCQRQTQRRADEATVVAAVQAVRHEHHRLGTRKLWHELPAHLTGTGITIGRDRLFALLGRHALLVPPLRRGYRTTWPGTWRCPNLLADAVVVRPNQAWVSDITYLATEEGFRYLVLITDVFSRRIMGYDLSASLSVEGLSRALVMAVRQVKTLAPGLIFHSDHGSQYTAQAIRDQLAQHQIRSSMGEVGNCYDNALAERINGILKIEYGLDQLFVAQALAQRAVQQAVFLYNYKRPHLALNYQKPAHFYDQHLRFSLH